MLWCSVVLLALCASVQGRAVNISNTWVLPEEGFPVFYRYFRDRISWYEADAVCQFHHANLVTGNIFKPFWVEALGPWGPRAYSVFCWMSYRLYSLPKTKEPRISRAKEIAIQHGNSARILESDLLAVDTTAQYDAVRAYLKELDITSAVWVGLIRSNPDGDFTWTDYRGLSGDGYWSSAPDTRTAPLCAAADPAADYRWEARACGGPTVASFICELPVPQWALGNEGCMVRALPALTILYLPESAAVQLTADCGLAGVKRVQCTGNVKREDLLKELSCTDEDESSTPSVTSTGTSWPVSSDTTFTDQDTTNDVTTEENITTEHEENVNQLNTVQSTPIPYKINTPIEYKLPKNDKINLNKIYLEKNLYLDDIHNNNLQSNDIPNIVNEQNYLTSEQLDKIEDEKHMQHKMLHEEFARLGNIDNIFTQPTDHFVPPLVMAKAKMSNDMTVLSLEEKHAQQIAGQRLSQHNGQQEHMYVDKSTTKEPNFVTDVPLVTTSKLLLNDYEKKDKIKPVMPKKYTEKYNDPKNKTLKIFNNKSLKIEKSTEYLSTQTETTVKDIETTTKILQHTSNNTTFEDDPLIDLTVIIKDGPTKFKNETLITNYTGDVSKLEVMLNNTGKIAENLTEASHKDFNLKNIYDNKSNVLSNHEVIKITIISDDNSTVHPTEFEITTKMPVFTEKFNDVHKISATAEFHIDNAGNSAVTTKPITAPTSPATTEQEHNNTTTTHMPITSAEVISSSSIVTLHTTTTTDKETTTEMPAISTTTTQQTDTDKTNSSESPMTMDIPNSTVNVLYTDGQDELDHNSTDSLEIDDFQSPLLSAASEPLHRPNRSRRPQQQNRIKFNPFRILG